MSDSVEHVCGLQGYCPGPPHYDPICPACCEKADRWAREMLARAPSLEGASHEGQTNPDDAGVAAANSSESGSRTTVGTRTTTRAQPSSLSDRDDPLRDPVRGALDSGRDGISDLEPLRAAVVPRPRPEPAEICICAAIQLADGRIIRGHRHDDCIQTAIKWQAEPRAAQQGFVTSRNRFVDRHEGMRLQNAAGIESVNGYRGEVLFSEDLY